MNLRILSFVALCLAAIPAFASQVTLEGQLIEKDHKTYLEYSEGQETRRVLVSPPFDSFRGQKVWVEGKFTTDSSGVEFFEIRNLVTEQKGVMLNGPVRSNGYGAVDFYPNNLHAQQLVDGKHLRLIFPEGFSWKKSAPSARVTGTVMRGALYVAPQAGSFDVVINHAKVDVGDLVVFSGILKANPNSAADATSSTTAQRFGSYEVSNVSNVYVKDKESGNFVPAEISGPLFATAADMGVGLLIEEGQKMFFAGRMSYAGHVLIGEVVPHAGIELPEFAVAGTNANAPAALETIGRATGVPYLRILDGGRQSLCKRILDPEIREKIRIIK